MEDGMAVSAGNMPRWITVVPPRLQVELREPPSKEGPPWCQRFPHSYTGRGPNGRRSIAWSGCWVRLRDDAHRWCWSNGIRYALRCRPGDLEAMISFRSQRHLALWTLSWT